MWPILVGAVLALVIAGAVYLTICVGRFQGIQFISGKWKWLRYLISFALIALVFYMVSYILSPVNAVMVFLHVTAFFIIYGIIMRLVMLISKKKFKIYWQGWLAIITSVVYLSAGWYMIHHVFQTDYHLDTSKNVHLNIAMFADSHIGTTFEGDGFAEHMKTIEAQDPDMVLVVGDYVDDWSKKEEMLKACKALGKMKVKYGVWFAYGNHDPGFYGSRDFTMEELEKALRDNGVHVLADEYELVDDKFYVVGRKDKSFEDRKSMKELLKGVDKDKYIIVMDHQPNSFDEEAASAADLVVSGHTHGGHFFPFNDLGVWFGLNDRTYGHEKRKGTDFIVTSGISDWEIQFKTGTKSEYVMIKVSHAE